MDGNGVVTNFPRATNYDQSWELYTETMWNWSWSILWETMCYYRKHIYTYVPTYQEIWGSKCYSYLWKRCLSISKHFISMRLKMNSRPVFVLPFLIDSYLIYVQRLKLNLLSWWHPCISKTLQVNSSKT